MKQQTQNKTEWKEKISNLINNHISIDFHKIYDDEGRKEVEIGVKKIRVKYIKEESFENLKQGSLEYFCELVFTDKKQLLRLLNQCKWGLTLLKIKGKREYWCCGAGNNRPFFIKHFGKLINRDWIYAQVYEVKVKIKDETTNATK